MQDNAESPKDSPLLPLFSCRPMTRLKSQKAPKGDIISVTHEKMCYIPVKLTGFSNLYTQKIWRTRGRIVIKGVA